MATVKAAAKLKLPRVRMPEQEPVERASGFIEVNCGLGVDEATGEATRCLRCRKADCVGGCPVGVDIPGFVAAVADGDLERAADILYADNVLPGITGRVCPQETQCEARCVLGKKGEPLAVGYLERFVADWAREHRQQTVVRAPSSGRRVAVVGSGPSGLTCAGELARRGHAVTVYEALHRAGGVLVYGIPEFRLPKAIVDQEVRKLEQLGVEIVCDVVVGQTYTVRDLFDEAGFDAVYIANGAGLPQFLGIPGEHLKGVYSANEYLTRVNLMGGYRGEDAETPVLRGRSVVVVGGGNTAMDAVRTARRLGAEEATLVYRRSAAEMPARIEEVHHAEAEGIVFRMLTNPVEVLGDEQGWVRAVRCQSMELGEPDASGRRRPVAVPGSEVDLECQVFVEAVGTRANPLLTQTTPEIVLDRKGQIQTDERGMTSMPGVFAGGDIVRGGATVILAMGDGKRAASAIDEYLGQQGPRG